ncbi:FHA domain-containing protein [Actinomyces bowdenii]|nr:FHA domain-containing protein [Actinomyces bowdenii]
MPATTGGRIGRALIDLGLILALFTWVVGWGVPAAMGACGLLIAVMTLMTALTGASPGGLVTGVRLRRVGDPTAAPGWAAAAHAAFVLLAFVPTAGVAALVLWGRSMMLGEHRNWFDRMAGTVLLSSRASSGVACSLVFDGAVIPVSGPLVLGRRPSPVRDHPGAQLVAVLQGDDSVSKTHVLVLPAPDGVYITDLGSTNGTHIESDTGVRRLAAGQQGHVGRGRQAYLGDGVCVVR